MENDEDFESELSIGNLDIVEHDEDDIVEVGDICLIYCRFF